MPVRTATISKVEQDELLAFLRKHPIYPYRKVFNVQCNATNFASSAGAMNGNGSEVVNYMTLSWTPDQTVGVVSIAPGFIVSPNTVVDFCGVVVSYRNSLSITNMDSTAVIDGDDIYQLVSNGGAINDFQVVYPLNYLVERGQSLYIHLLLGNTTVATGTANMTGHIIFGTLKGGI